MKKFFSLVLALVMALSLTTMAWGAPVTTLPTADANGVATLAENTEYDDITDATGVTKIVGASGAKIGDMALGPVNGLTVSGVTFTGVVQLCDADNVTFTNCIFEDGAILKFTVVSGITNENVTIENCKFLGTSAANTNRIEVGAAAGNTVITGNEIASSGYHAIAVINGFAGNVEIANNTVTGAANCAIRLSENTADATLAIQGNTVTGTMSTAAIKANTLTDVDAEIWNNEWNGATVTAGLEDATSGGATSATLYVWDTVGAEWDVDFIATGADLDDLKVDDDYVLGDFYTVDGMYFVETTAASAVYKLVYGAKTVYLAQVDIADYTFVAKASVLKVVETADAECGDFHTAVVTPKDVFYVSYNAKTGAPEGFYKADKTTDTYVLVNGKLVEVEVLGAGVVAQLMHAFKGYDVVNYQYTTVKCAECGKVAKLYANAEAAGKKAQGPIEGGWITFADYMDFGAAPSTDKVVESAQTFDAGIAMYVGMSVMAAAGSAVVLKKKD